MFALVRPIEVNTTNILILTRKLPEPRASQHLLSRDGADPDFSSANIAGNLWTVVLPPFNLTARYGQAAATIERATFAALITIFHNCVGPLE